MLISFIIGVYPFKHDSKMNELNGYDLTKHTLAAVVVCVSFIDFIWNARILGCCCNVCVLLCSSLHRHLPLYSIYSTVFSVLFINARSELLLWIAKFRMRFFLSLSLIRCRKRYSFSNKSFYAIIWTLHHLNCVEFIFYSSVVYHMVCLLFTHCASYET